MFSEDARTLKVYVKRSNSNDLGTPVWSMHGPHGMEWHAAQVEIDGKGDTYQFVFEAVYGNSYGCEISIDDVLVTDRCVGPKECTFEGTHPHLCGWSNRKFGGLEWSVGQGNNSGFTTVPSNDHTYHSGFGKYIHIDTSSKTSSGKRAIIDSPWYPPNKNSSCFQFWYHMYGESIGRLSLDVVRKTLVFPISRIWSKSFNQGNKWFLAQANVEVQKNDFKLRFIGVNRNGSIGNIAIDDIRIFDGPCNSIGTCDFESDKCTWKNAVQEDDYDWKVSSGRRFFGDDTPLNDHTLKSPNGNYVSMDRKDDREVGKKARLESELIDRFDQKTAPHCLTFWYYMNIKQNGTLNLYIKTGIGSSHEKLVWSLTGFQNWKWNQGSAPIYSDKDFQMVFEAIRGEDFATSISLDDIVFSKSKCSVHPRAAIPKVIPTLKPTPLPTTQAVTTVHPTKKGVIIVKFNIKGELEIHVD